MNSEEWVKNSKTIINESSKKLSELKSHFVRILPYWIAGALTAVIATTYAKMFALFENMSLLIFKESGYWYLLIAPVAFFLSWFTVHRYAPYANGSGIPQLMAAAEMAHSKKAEGSIGKLLGFRIIFAKILSSLVGVIGGGSIGREGPTLQISGSIFYLFNKHFPQYFEAKNRYAFLLAGSASGLASAFNTPLGGIVYVVEELAKSHLSLFRTGVIHAVIFSGLISQLLMGSYLYFGYPKTGVFEIHSLGSIIILSIFAGLVVSGFSQSLKLVVVRRETLLSFKQRAFFSVLCGILFASLAIWVSNHSLGPGKALLNQVLFSQDHANFTDILGRFFGSLLTYSAGGAGGIFAPTLSLGGAASSFLDSAAGFKIGPIATLVGMTAGLSALTHSPLTSFILVLEMTDRHSAIFPLMIASVIGHGISKLISKQSFYEFVFAKIYSRFTDQDRT